MDLYVLERALSSTHSHVAAPFFAAVLVSIAMIQTRRLTRTEDTGAIVFYFQTSTTLASLLLMLAAEAWPDFRAAVRDALSAGPLTVGELGEEGKHEGLF